MVNVPQHITNVTYIVQQVQVRVTRLKCCLCSQLGKVKVSIGNTECIKLVYL
jgi:hypothetical protein